MDTGEEDNGAAVEFVIGLPKIEYENGRVTLELKEMLLSGGISENGSIQIENIVNGGSPQIKVVSSSGLSFGALSSLGTITLGTTVLGSTSSTVVLAEWDKRYGIYPRFGSSFSCILSSSKPFSLSSYNLVAAPLPKPLLTLT